MGRYQRDPFEYGTFYHVYNKVVTGEILFKNDDDYKTFLDKFNKYFSPYCLIAAYCLMPNHFHFLLRVNDKEKMDLSNEKTNAARKVIEQKEPLSFFFEHQLSRMLSGVAIKYNNINNRVGPLFKQGTKHVELKTEDRIVYQLCYIHHNPIHHHYVKNYSDWKFSSYGAYLSNQKSNIAREFMLEIIGGSSPFDSLHNDFKVDPDLE